MNIKDAKQIVESLGFMLVFEEAEDDSVDSTQKVFKGDIEYNVHFQVDEGYPIIGLYQTDCIEAGLEDSPFTLRWTHYFDDEITPEIVHLFLSQAVPLTEATKDYDEQQAKKRAVLDAMTPEEREEHYAANRALLRAGVR